MSQATPCNRCVYTAIVKDADRRGRDVQLRAAEGNYELGGQDVYVNGKFVVWLMELPATCQC